MGVIWSLQENLLAHESKHAEERAELQECFSELNSARAQLRENFQSSFVESAAEIPSRESAAPAPNFSNLRSELADDIRVCRDEIRRQQDALHTAEHDMGELGGLHHQLASDIAGLRKRMTLRRKPLRRIWNDDIEATRTDTELIWQSGRGTGFSKQEAVSLSANDSVPNLSQLAPCHADDGVLHGDSSAPSLLSRLEFEADAAASERARLRLESDQLMFESEELVDAEPDTYTDVDARVEVLSERRRAVAMRVRRLSLALSEVDEAILSASQLSGAPRLSTTCTISTKRVSFSSTACDE